MQPVSNFRRFIRSAVLPARAHHTWHGPEVPCYEVFYEKKYLSVLYCRICGDYHFISNECKTSGLY